MPNRNYIEIIGHVGMEPEIRFSPDGKAVCNFSIATNRRYTDKSGEKRDTTDWFGVTTWNKVAESCNQFVKKGMSVMVIGRVSLDEWFTEKREHRSRMRITANQVIFLEKLNNSATFYGIEHDELEPEDIPF